MCPMQKHARFNLVIVALALGVILLLYPHLGRGALGGAGILGLMGFGVFYYREKQGRVVTDERDTLIGQRSALAAYSIFWLAFVAAVTVLAPVYYSYSGAVPIPVLENAFVALVLVFIVAWSTATLVQYAWGGVDAKPQ